MAAKWRTCQKWTQAQRRANAMLTKINTTKRLPIQFCQIVTSLFLHQFCYSLPYNKKKQLFNIANYYHCIVFNCSLSLLILLIFHTNCSLIYLNATNFFYNLSTQLDLGIRIKKTNYY